MKMNLLTFTFLVMLLNAGCHSGKKVEAQSTPAESVITQSSIPTQPSTPSMFEWRGVYDGMPLAEFQAKHGKNCGQSPRSNYGCVAGGPGDITALFFQGHLYSFEVFCDDDETSAYKYRCRKLFADVKAHFGKPRYDNVKFGARAIGWQSSHELALYQPPDESRSSGMLEVCSHDFSPRSQCHPER